MKKAILTTKVGMTQIFNEDGVLTPVTVLQAGLKVADVDAFEIHEAFAGQVRLRK